MNVKGSQNSISKDPWSAKAILDAARQYGKRGSYLHYEFYKGLLHDIGAYGYERKLAEILQV